MASSPEDADRPLESPSSPPLSPESNADASPPKPPKSPPTLRSVSANSSTSIMTASSTPLGTLNAARNPRAQAPPLANRSSGLNMPKDILDKLNAVRLRAGPPPNPQAGQSGNQQVMSPGGAPGAQLPTSPQGPMAANPGNIPANFRFPPGAKPGLPNFVSAPAVPRMQGGHKPSLAEKRGMKPLGGLPGSSPTGSPAPPAGGRKKPGLTLSQLNGDQGAQAQPKKQETMMDKYAEYLDAKTGSLRFKGKAVLNSEGIQFASGASFSISLDEVDTLDELGKGNYGTVYKVRHSRPRIRKPGQGLAGNKAPVSQDESSPVTSKPIGGTGIVMAMKEMRLELDDAKFATIIMELDVLHRCVSPYIIDFYGAFFQEGAVYICMEFMDGGSIDKLYGDGIPEGVLRKITLATTMGLKSLKEEHNIIHRDVKPTNILMNTKGQIKICDFGVSGNLVASIAKTNIGCQSYMAPERISTGGVAQAGANPGGGTYSVQSDIWSLGLTIIECALGRYPYPPETYNNIFSQLSAIVDGEPPDLPDDRYSPEARDFVRGCLNKIPNLRPTYPMLLQHPWLSTLVKPATILEEDEEGVTDEPAPAEDAAPPVSTNDEVVFDKEIADWVKDAMEKKRTGKMGKGVQKPALHAAPLDAVSSPSKNGTQGLEQPPFPTDAAT